MDAVVDGKGRKRGVAIGVLVVLVLAGVIGAVVTPTFLGARSRVSSLSVPDGTGAPMQEEMASDMSSKATFEGEFATARSADSSVGYDAVESAPVPALAQGTGDVAAPAPNATIGPRVIKTADLSLVIEDNGFTDSFDRASLVASKYDGFVVDSFTEGTRAKAGSMTIRVPVANYDAALSDLRDIGTEIERENASGVDVTDQFVDLEARLRSWEAQHRVLLKLMDDANSIPETMQVQNEIQRVQFEIESIRGQLRMMRDQTSLATITVSMHEKGASAPKGDTDRPSLAVAFDAAIAGFLTVISTVIVGLGYLLPILAFALAGWLVWRRVRRAPAPPAPAA